LSCLSPLVRIGTSLIYAELFETGLIQDDDSTLEVIKTVSLQAKAVLKVMNSTFLAPYAIRRKTNTAY